LNFDFLSSLFKDTLFLSFFYYFSPFSSAKKPRHFSLILRKSLYSRVFNLARLKTRSLFYDLDLLTKYITLPSSSCAIELFATSWKVVIS